MGFSRSKASVGGSRTSLNTAEAEIKASYERRLAEMQSRILAQKKQEIK